MNLDLLVEMELNRWDWSNIIEAHGPATNIPVAIRELMLAQNVEESEIAYWKLENHIVVQGNVFEAAAYAVPVFMAALVKTDRPTHFVISTMDLFYQIIAGGVHEEEIARGMPDLKERCIAAMREGIWILYANYLQGRVRRSLGEVISMLDDDPYRLKYLDEKRGKSESK